MNGEYRGRAFLTPIALCFVFYLAQSNNDAMQKFKMIARGMRPLFIDESVAAILGCDRSESNIDMAFELCKNTVW